MQHMKQEHETTLAAAKFVLTEDVLNEEPKKFRVRRAAWMSEWGEVLEV
jgi:hypothetical protein